MHNQALSTGATLIWLLVFVSWDAVLNYIITLLFTQDPCPKQVPGWKCFGDESGLNSQWDFLKDTSEVLHKLKVWSEWICWVQQEKMVLLPRQMNATKRRCCKSPKWNCTSYFNQNVCRWPLTVSCFLDAQRETPGTNMIKYWALTTAAEIHGSSCCLIPLEVRKSEWEELT